jgi:hypothetical protein
MNSSIPQIGDLVLRFQSDGTPIVGIVLEKGRLLYHIEWCSMEAGLQVITCGVIAANNYRKAYLEWKRTNYLDS